MASALQSSIVITCITEALVFPSITALLLDLTIVPISMADAQQLNVASHSNVSEEESRRYLDQLQRETTSTMIPALVFLGILAVTGLIGNSIVIFVYFCKLPWSATRILIITIAMFDLVANVIAIPGDIYDTFHIWDFNNPPLCRARLFFSAFATLSSGMALVAVAVTRYRKVCCPHNWQVTTNNAKIISIGIGCFGVLISVPNAILNGRQTKKTPRSDIFAYECTTDDAYRDTIYPLLNYVLFLLLYVVCSGCLTVLYFLIGAKAWKHSKSYGASTGLSSPTSPCETSYKTPRVSENCDNHNECNCIRPGIAFKRNVDKSITDDSTSQSTNRVGDNTMKVFHVGNEANKAPIAYNIRIFTDRVEIRTSLIGEFFAQLQKTNSFGTDLSSYENSQCNNTGQRRKIQHGNGSGGDTCTGGIRIMENNISDEVMRTVKCNLENIDSNEKYTKGSTVECLNRGDNTRAARTDDETNETVNATFHSKECSAKTVSIYDNVLDLNSGVGNDRQSHQSIQTAANEVPIESDPLSIFRWLDVIYCPDDGHTTSDSNCVQRETSLSFRLALNNNLLQKTEWLRNSISEVMTRQVEMAEDHMAEDHMAEGHMAEGHMAEGHMAEVHMAVGGCVDSVPVQVPVWTNIRTCNSPEIPCDSGVNASALSQQGHLPRSPMQEMLLKRFVLSLSPENKVKRRSMGRITVMLCIISAIYILGYLPHLGLMFVKFLSPDVLENMSMVGRTFYNLFLRTFFLNCAINPIIYSLCDDNFRRKCLTCP